MGRTVAFLASFIAVVGTCVGLVRWLAAQDVSAVAVIVVIAVISTLMRFAHRRVKRAYGWEMDSDSAAERSWTQIPVLFAAVAAGLLVGDYPIVGLLFVTLAFVLVAGPLVGDLYTIDKASRKQCPDCGETVKVGARVCRYCSYRWDDADALRRTTPRD